MLSRGLGLLLRGGRCPGGLLGLMPRAFGVFGARLGVGGGLAGGDGLGLGPLHPAQRTLLSLTEELQRLAEPLLQRGDRGRKVPGQSLGAGEGLVNGRRIDRPPVTAGLVSVGLTAVLGRTPPP
ncbi:hypothetical protein [Actinomadura kijaniata]|uniref:hypothetical protein n=1 Tax=Actinomadura kijaniata TaxID=46161 RepID=UPI0012FA059E|nr:hypothetical protein [Actinomadura kijaniata]